MSWSMDDTTGIVNYSELNWECIDNSSLIPEFEITWIEEANKDAKLKIWLKSGKNQKVSDKKLIRLFIFFTKK